MTFVSIFVAERRHDFFILIKCDRPASGWPIIDREYRCKRDNSKRRRGAVCETIGHQVIVALERTETAAEDTPI